MRNPEKVLNTLCLHSKISDYKYERLYRILFNEEMFFVAYQRIYAKQGNMTPGTDGQTIDQMSIQRIECLIESLRNETYQPQPARRVYIPKKNGKSRPLGIPSFEDKLVQEVARMVLEAIYEGHFESTSHGFRPYKSCHTALTHIQRQFTGTRWFIEGDIKGFFDNIDHNILINILCERISDERFLRLIRKFLNAGYIENWKYNRTYSGTPQGGIISPILANIYLDKFDKYVHEYTEKFNVGVKRQRNAAYFQMNTTAVNLRKKLKTETDPRVKAELAEKVRSLQLEMRSIPCSHEIDENYRRMKYVRYADDFLIGVIGSKADCEKIKAEIAQYMSNDLKLELSAEKTLITHAQKTAKFLGYEISVRKSSAMKRNRKGVLQRDFNGRVMLLLPMETVKKKLREYDAIDFEQVNGKEIWKPKSRSYLTAKKPYDILAQYNWEIRGFYNYYRIANNVSATCSKFGYIMEYSMYMTLAQKLRSSITKVMKRFYKDKQFIIPYTDDKGRRQYRIFYDGGFKRQNGITDTGCDTQPFTVLMPYPTLVERLKANHCEMCGAEGTTVMHQVRTLKSLSTENEWNKIMLKRNRKTLSVKHAIPKYKNMANRVILSVESRIRGDVYVRFGGRFSETYRSNAVRRRVPSLHYVFETEKMDSIVTLLMTLWKRDDEPPTRAEEVALSNAVNLYLDKIKTSRKVVPSFNTFYEFIQKDYQKVLKSKNTREKDFDVHNFLNVLEPYYKGGEYDFLLNSDKQLDLLNKRFIVFELDNIKGAPVKAA